MGLRNKVYWEKLMTKTEGKVIRKKGGGGEGREETERESRGERNSHTEKYDMWLIKGSL